MSLPDFNYAFERRSHQELSEINLRGTPYHVLIVLEWRFLMIGNHTIRLLPVVHIFLSSYRISSFHGENTLFGIYGSDSIFFAILELSTFALKTIFHNFRSLGADFNGAPTATASPTPFAVTTTFIVVV